MEWIAVYQTMQTVKSLELFSPKGIYTRVKRLSRIARCKNLLSGHWRLGLRREALLVDMAACLPCHRSRIIPLNQALDQVIIPCEKCDRQSNETLCRWSAAPMLRPHRSPMHLQKKFCMQTSFFPHTHIFVGSILH